MSMPFDPESIRNEPDEESTENVIELLRRYDNELARSGKIDLADTEEYLLSNHTPPEEAELLEEEALAEQEQAELEEFTKLLRSTLNLVGLADPRSVTPENVKALDQEIFEQLDPYNAESLFFEVARKLHRRLGQYEPVTWRRIVEQAKPENKQALDIDNLKLEQRLRAFTYLIELGIDHNQISDMVKSSAEAGVAAPSKRQNVNRMGFFFEQEPLLEGLVRALKKRAAKREVSGKPPLSAQRAVKMGQIVLRLQKERLENRLKRQDALPFGHDRIWDSIDREVYKKIHGRIKVSLAIAELIQAEMRTETVDDFLNEL